VDIILISPVSANFPVPVTAIESTVAVSGRSCYDAPRRARRTREARQDALDKFTPFEVSPRPKGHPFLDVSERPSDTWSKSGVETSPGVLYPSGTLASSVHHFTLADLSLNKLESLLYSGLPYLLRTRLHAYTRMSGTNAVILIRALAQAGSARDGADAGSPLALLADSPVVCPLENRGPLYYSRRSCKPINGRRRSPHQCRPHHFR
jgi:hypothetical protein